MSIETFIMIAAAVALGVALAPVVRWVLSFLAGVAILVGIVGGFLGAVVWLFLVPLIWPDFARALGWLYFLVGFVALGVSSGLLTFSGWLARRTEPPEAADEPIDRDEKRRQKIALIGDLLHAGVATEEDIDELRRLQAEEARASKRAKCRS